MSARPAGVLADIMAAPTAPSTISTSTSTSHYCTAEGIPLVMLEEDLIARRHYLQSIPPGATRDQAQREIQEVQNQIDSKKLPSIPMDFLAPGTGAGGETNNTSSSRSSSTDSLLQVSNLYAGGGWNAGRKRNRDSLGTEDVRGEMVKSPRYTPSPATTFASTPAVGSPGSSDGFSAYRDNK